MAKYDHEKLAAVTTMISVAERPWASMRAWIFTFRVSAHLLPGWSPQRRRRTDRLRRWQPLLP